MIELKLDLGLILALYLLLLLIGIGYNFLVADWERKRYLEGFVSIAVVIGVLYTEGFVVAFTWAWQLPGWLWGAINLGAFTASGVPMIAGSIWRYIKNRNRDREEYVQRAERMAKYSAGDEGPGR